MTLFATALQIIGGLAVLLTALAVLAIAAEWAVNRIVRACGVYKLVVEFMWERAKRKHEEEAKR